MGCKHDERLEPCLFCQHEAELKTAERELNLAISALTAIGRGECECAICAEQALEDIGEGGEK